MKKILVASSALVAVGFAGAAQASEPISLSVGGYMEQWIGVADQEDRFESENAFQSDSEIYFSGETTLDNGIVVGAKVELEAEGGNDTTMIDEQYLYINGGFGQVKLGAEDGAAADMSITAPAVGPAGVNDGDMPNYVTLRATPDNVWDDGDAKKLTYYTPVLGGFRAGVSYTSDDNSENDDTTTSGSSTNPGDSLVSAGIEYRGDFDGVSLAVAATGESKQEGEWYHVGATVGFGNFTVGASYGLKEAEFDLNENSTTTADDDMGIDFGVSYAMDAATVSATYMYAEMEDSATTSGVDEFNGVDLGLAYTLGAGVSWRSSVYWFDYDAVAAASDNEGFGVITGLRLDF
ncbi:MAG: porin [Thalassospira sp. Nap_22]|nr:MAG: porin [Thalassospira sp. Nap_22]